MSHKCMGELRATYEDAWTMQLASNSVVGTAAMYMVIEGQFTQKVQGLTGHALSSNRSDNEVAYAICTVSSNVM
jgi:hypothetical protein